LAQRVERIAALAREIAPLVGADADEAEMAARLSKADLLSGMVSEFPELQGIMGGYYARLAGHSDAVADAVRDHYKPQGPADTLPTAPVTVAVALADKLDTLVGFFAIDEKPTGSKDPFALRRAALGVIRLVLENGVRLPLQRTWNEHLKRIANHLADDVREALEKLPYNEVVESGVDFSQVVETRTGVTRMLARINGNQGLRVFLAERLKVLLREEGKRHDLIDAVFQVISGKTDDDLVRIVRRVEALAAFLATDDGANLLAGYKRATSILEKEEKKGWKPGMVQTGLPNQPEPEAVLAFAVAAARTSVETALDIEDFAAAMTALARLRGPVDAFLDGVMVNSTVEQERDNRLKLLGQVRDVMGQVADFGQIAG